MNGLRFGKAIRVIVGLLFAFILFITASCSPPTENSADEPKITATLEILVTPSVGKLLIIADVVNLRTGPGVTFDLHGTLNKGDTVEFDGVLATGSWYRINDGSWIAESFVELVNNEISEATLPVTATASPTAVPLETPSPTITIAAIESTKILPTQTPSATTALTDSSVTCQTTGDVFLFSGPGNTNAYHIVKALNKGSEMIVLGGNRQNGNHTHYKVRNDEGNQGWLFIELCPIIGNPSIDFTSFPPTFTPTGTPTPIPSLTPTPSSTPTPSPTLITVVLPTPSATAAATAAAGHPTQIPPDPPTPSPTVLPGTATPIPPDPPTPQATGTQPPPNAFR